METEEYIKMLSSPQTPRGDGNTCTEVCVPASEMHPVSQANMRCNSEPDMNQCSTNTLDILRSGHSVENIYEHIH